MHVKIYLRALRNGTPTPQQEENFIRSVAPYSASKKITRGVWSKLGVRKSVLDRVDWKYHGP